jgi:translation initiation factor 5A
MFTISNWCVFLLTCHRGLPFSKHLRGFRIFAIICCLRVIASTDNKMGDADIDEYADVGAGASKTFPQISAALRKGGYVLMEDRPCQIREMSTKGDQVHLVAVDIFTGKEYEGSFPATRMMDVPNVVHKALQLIDIQDGFLSLMDDSGQTRDDVKLPEGKLGAEIKERFGNDEGLMIDILAAMDEDQAIGVSKQPRFFKMQ